MAANWSGSGPGVKSGAGAEQQEELALVAGLAAGDAAAFRRLLERHLATVVATARRLLNDAAEAEDVAQETMLRLWRTGGTVDVGPAGLKPWLRRVAVNLAIDRMRSARRVDVTDEVPDQRQEAEQLAILEGREMKDRVAAALTALPERQRQALSLFHYEGMSQIEIAAAMGISDEAVESLLARARRSLRQELEQDWRALLSSDG